MLCRAHPLDDGRVLAPGDQFRGALDLLDVGGGRHQERFFAAGSLHGVEALANGVGVRAIHHSGHGLGGFLAEKRGRGLALLSCVFYPVLVHMFRTWRADPDYSHGLLIVPLSLYFAYGKTPQLRKAEFNGSWWGVAVLLVGVVAVCIGELGGLLTALRSGYVLALMGFVLLLAGRQVFEILLFPMAFLFLMVPLPQSLVNIIAFPLQLIAAGWAVGSLQAFGIPVLL